MNTIAATLRPIPFPSMARLRNDPVTQVFSLLRIGFVVLPILMGLDKFVEVMNENWTAYLATEFNDVIPVGAIEILAGIIVLIVPRFGGLLVAGWLGGIILSLLLVGGYGDIALRDFGLLLGALALFRLAGTKEAYGDDGVAERHASSAEPVARSFEHRPST